MQCISNDNTIRSKYNGREHFYFHYKNTGDIAGKIVPPESRSVVMVIRRGDVIASTYTDIETGEYYFTALQRGYYELKIVARRLGFEPMIVSEVPVNGGNVTMISDIALNKLNGRQ